MDVYGQNEQQCNAPTEKEIGQEWVQESGWESMGTEQKVQALASLFGSTKSNWQLRMFAFDLLQELSAEERPQRLAEIFEESDIIESLKVQISENRSAIVKAICPAVAALAVNMDNYFLPFSLELISALMKPLKKSQIVFRKASEKCLQTLTSVPTCLSKESIEFIVDSAIQDKSAEVRKVNVGLLGILLKQGIPLDRNRVQELILSAIADSKPDVREAGRGLFQKYMESRRMEANELLNTLSEKTKKQLLNDSNN